MKNIILFASGNGSNAQNICAHFDQHPTIKVLALFCNNPQAAVIQKMAAFGVPVHVFSKADFLNSTVFEPLINQYKPDLVVLAGFLWLMPEYLVNKFSQQIINIHPALLPKSGGKGMYGHYVHEAVLAANEKEHGITIHFVNQNYDEGAIIFQAKFEVSPTDDLVQLQQKIAALEMQYFPEAIKRLLQNL